MHRILGHPLGVIVLGPWVLLFKIAWDGLSSANDVVVLLFRTLWRFPLLFKNPELTLKQCIGIGISSLPLVFVTSLFSGMVAAVQAAYQFRNFVPDKFIGTAVCKMVIIELSPVLMGLVMAGRVGSALAAEIGSMKEKEELDAMSVLDLDPLRYLALPRLITFMIMMPALSLFSSFLAIVGGWLVSVLALDLTTYTYISGLKFQFVPLELYSGLVKSFVFGILIFLMGYHHGINAGAGARGVGEATMKVVVSSCVLILIFDFIITLLMFH
jgi:phospholipid/cholesterol/gamma-HCH transport system permease protein